MRKIGKKNKPRQDRSTYRLIICHEAFSTLGHNCKGNASNLNKSGYLRKTAYLKCSKRLVNKNKLLEDQKAVLTLLNSKHLAHACKCCKTRQDAPCKYYLFLACYTDLSIENTQDKSNKNDYALRRILRQRK